MKDPLSLIDLNSIQKLKKKNHTSTHDSFIFIVYPQSRPQLRIHKTYQTFL